MPTSLQQNIRCWHALYTTTELLLLACPLHDNRTSASGMPTKRQQNIYCCHAHYTTTEYLLLACPLHDNRTPASGMPTKRQQNICCWHAHYTTTEHLLLACPLHDDFGRLFWLVKTSVTRNLNAAWTTCSARQPSFTASLSDRQKEKDERRLALECILTSR